MDLYPAQAPAPATSPASGMVLIEVNSDSGSDFSMGFPVPAADLMTALQLLEPAKRLHGLAPTSKDISTASPTAKSPAEG